MQFPARFRHGYLNYFIFITGNQPNPEALVFSRQELVERYYNIAYHQKLSFAHTNSILTEYGFLNTGSTSHKIKLMDQYNLLDDEGNIQEHKIMLSVQEQEARKMRWDVPSLKEFLENSQYGYNFKMEETPLESLMEEYFSKEDIASASESLKETRRSMNACFSEY